MAEANPLSMIEHELRDSIGAHLPQSKFLARFLAALLAVQHVTLHRIACAFPSSAKPESSLRRIGRFLDDFRLTPDRFARALAALLPVPKPWVLALDRTDWKLGKTSLNLLVLAVVHQGTAFPLLWLPLGVGASDTAERISVLSRFVALFGTEAIAFVTADREFIGAQWLAWLQQHKISFRIRIRACDLLHDRDGRACEAADLIWRRFRCRKHPYHLWGVPVYVGGRPLNSGDVLIVVSDVPGDPATDYRCRWGIETLFQSLKGRGFDLEATHVTKPERLSRLLGLLAIGFVWCFRVGEQAVPAEKVLVKSHGRRARSVFRSGLDVLRRLLLSVCGHFHPRDFVMILGQLRPA